MSKKPNYEELEQKIKELEKQVTSQVSPLTDEIPQTTSVAPKVTTGPETPKRILVIDDSEIDRMVLEEILKQAGYKVFMASDGKEGIEQFNVNPVDLVITDMVMPEKMGIDLILELRKKHPDLMIIAMSAGGDFGAELELDTARPFGAYTIKKPFDPKKVEKLVAELMSQEANQVLIRKEEQNKTLKVERELIDKEITFSKKLGLNFCLLEIQVSQSVPRGLSKILPGRVISCHTLSTVRKYYIILPKTDEKGVKAVKGEIFELAKTHNWGDITIRESAYPKDGNTSDALLDKFLKEVFFQNS